VTLALSCLRWFPLGLIFHSSPPALNLSFFELFSSSDLSCHATPEFFVFLRVRWCRIWISPAANRDFWYYSTPLRSSFLLVSLSVVKPSLDTWSFFLSLQQIPYLTLPLAVFQVSFRFLILLLFPFFTWFL
jgi:hypothetical protein